ncbi:MAG TPA: nitroreductase family protein [Spirochaetota bacterium]|nr:nitroreductase family protein [Spirochaetota bacterium]HPC40160.1 nitroreductase family protein [Spirochaetota bacterium]HPL16453.1 nitroreductase family protein [Spirochaetota bacterium]HQF08564.1 nitroreductase family protein [Spirochaetota bacterium]HQH97199.1 nitroreductase family protein [Spirochaetota bacterium]
MDFKDIVAKNRSYRRFHQEHRVSVETLRNLVDLARLTPSAANRQPLRYVLSVLPERNEIVFRHIAWAAYLTDWPGPAEGERPSAYIMILNDTTISTTVDCDHGIAAQTILLGAVEAGLGGCMIGAIQKEGLRAALNIPEKYDILLVLALGKPKETITIEPVGPEGDIRYWRDGKETHHVPKRSLDDLILDL